MHSPQEDYTSVPPQEDQRSPPGSSQGETVTTQAMKSRCTSSSQFTPMEFLFITAPLNSPLSFVKKQSSPLISGHAYGFAMGYMSQIAILP